MRPFNTAASHALGGLKNVIKIVPWMRTGTIVSAAVAFVAVDRVCKQTEF